MYSHQKLSFAIILFLSFGTNFISSFLKQCEYPNQDPNKIDESFMNKTKIFPPKIIENMIKTLRDLPIKKMKKEIEHVALNIIYFF